ncbi:hypothetical protein A2U01_0059795 [Trifolium medium]|uniref:Uncharacterized protein n=1 Tax=Trifolium medium TaxID=97028 RepID=A0A392RQU1_9FABA|nr:hypothetical protein [Trifolium medium]
MAEDDTWSNEHEALLKAVIREFGTPTWSQIKEDSKYRKLAPSRVGKGSGSPMVGE